MASPLLEGLTSWYDFEDNILDSHGSNDLSPLVGAIRFADGLRGRCFENDNGSSSVPGSTSADFNPGNADFTIAFWFKRATDGVTALVSQSTVLAGRAWYVEAFGGVTPGIRFRVSANGSSDTDLIAKTFTIQNGVWTFVCAWHDAGNDVIGIQIDDEAPATKSYSSGVAQIENGRLAVGQFANGATRFPGSFDSLGFWNRVLTPEERGLLYAEGAGVDYSEVGVAGDGLFLLGY